jgi:hypothetical protein
MFIPGQSWYCCRQDSSYPYNTLFLLLIPFPIPYPLFPIPYPPILLFLRNPYRSSLLPRPGLFRLHYSYFLATFISVFLPSGLFKLLAYEIPCGFIRRKIIHFPKLSCFGDFWFAQIPGGGSGWTFTTKILSA